LPLRSESGSLVRHGVPLDEASIDADVARVVRRLMRAGYEAYLVGGCVRDLLLGKQPKDFDVATSARPEDVRALFRNSRIIGRRFRLVHVLFANRKVIEVATFRRNPNPDDAGEESDILIRSDNAFGTVEEDALRRDFTINALFYDVEAREILDFSTGMRDIERRAVRTIGDPATRFREDPVRILRAVKFAGKLDLGIDADVVDAMVATRESLVQSAKPRVFEEILRLMRSGASRRSLFLAWEMGLLHVLLPELAAMLDDFDGEDGASVRVFRLLSELDARTQERREPYDDVVLWTLLLLEPVLEACDGANERLGAVIEFCEPIFERLAVHRRIGDAMRRILAVLPRLFSGRVGKFARTELFEQAVAVAEIGLAARGDREALARLRQAVGPMAPGNTAPAPQQSRPPRFSPGARRGALGAGPGWPVGGRSGRGEIGFCRSRGVLTRGGPG
jgi:poly(A) polymerase